MENEIICLDTSVLIDFYRKKVKEKSSFYQLTTKYNLFAASVITEFELLVGADTQQVEYWNKFFDRIILLPFDKAASNTAIEITKHLKAAIKLIEIPDIFIGATALANKMKIATLNTKHFERIPNLVIIVD